MHTWKQRGALTISLDFELYWGARDRTTIGNYRNNLLGERRIVPALLKLFGELQIYEKPHLNAAPGGADEKCVLPEAAAIRYSSGLAIRRASHCVYDTCDHLLWAPKYRKWVWQGAIRQGVRELCCEIAGHHGFEIEELEVDKEHVHLFLSFPPKYSISAVVGLLKAVSAKEIPEEFPEVRKQLWGGEFWEDGHVVRTLGDK